MVPAEQGCFPAQLGAVSLEKRHVAPICILTQWYLSRPVVGSAERLALGLNYEVLKAWLPAMSASDE
jgi:hypothetical protein